MLFFRVSSCVSWAIPFAGLPSSDLAHVVSRVAAAQPVPQPLRALAQRRGPDLPKPVALAQMLNGYDYVVAHQKVLNRRQQRERSWLCISSLLRYLRCLCVQFSHLPKRVALRQVLYRDYGVVRHGHKG